MVISKFIGFSSKSSLQKNNSNPIISQNINILYNNFNNYPYSDINNPELNDNEINNIQNIQNIQKNQLKLDPSEYLFEKYGKRGWLCECCNNFNFASRMKCNKCGVKIKPIIIKNIQNNISEQKKKKEKKKLIKKRGDWICPNCSNNNFAFRDNCNRCQLSKQKAILIIQQMQMMNKMKENNNTGVNSTNKNVNNNQMMNQQINQLIQNNLINNLQKNNNIQQQQNINNINNDLNGNYSHIEQLLYLMKGNNQ